MNTSEAEFIKTVPNQKVVEIGSKVACDKNNIYCKINKATMFSAMRDLKEPATVNGKETIPKEAFALFMYFASNASGYKFALSQQAVLADTGIKRDAYQSAVNFLIAKGYLVPKHEGSNWYVFHEQPLRCTNATTNKE